MTGPFLTSKTLPGHTHTTELFGVTYSSPLGKAGASISISMADFRMVGFGKLGQGYGLRLGGGALRAPL